jgi:4-amino-4-deoxy-L-arabinose transferase-like glycosyltransferase
MNASTLYKAIPAKAYPVIVLVLPIIIMVIFWRIMPASLQNNDKTDYARFYFPVAQNILHGNGITFEGKTALDYPPGYPIILAVTLFLVKPLHGSDSILILVCLSLCAWLVFGMAKMLWDPGRALLASVAWSCYPFVYYTFVKQNSEIPFMVFFYACLLCLMLGWRYGRHAKTWFFTAGVLCGLSMLIRPIGIGVGVVIAALMLFGKSHTLAKRIVFIACLLIGNLVAIVPWEAWVLHKTGAVVILCKGRDSFSMYDGLTFAFPEPGVVGGRKGIKVPPDVEQVMLDVRSMYSDSTTAKQLRDFMIEKFKRRPAAIIKLFLIKAARAWYGTNANRFERMILLYHCIFMALVVFAGALFWRRRPPERFMTIAAVALVFYFWGMAILALSIARYLAPLLPLLLIFLPSITLWRGKTNRL